MKVEQIKQLVPATDWRAVFVYHGEMELAPQDPNLDLLKRSPLKVRP